MWLGYYTKYKFYVTGVGERSARRNWAGNSKPTTFYFWFGLQVTRNYYETLKKKTKDFLYLLTKR